MELDLLTSASTFRDETKTPSMRVVGQNPVRESHSLHETYLLHAANIYICTTTARVVGQNPVRKSHSPGHIQHSTFCAPKVNALT